MSSPNMVQILLWFQLASNYKHFYSCLLYCVRCFNTASFAS